MFSAMQSEQLDDEVERHAYNAAFHELGFCWHWNQDTYRGLVQKAADTGDRVRLYLEASQPHLLRAYDASFLVATIEAAKAGQVRRGATSAISTWSGVDWEKLSGGQVGA